MDSNKPIGDATPTTPADAWQQAFFAMPEDAQSWFVSPKIGDLIVAIAKKFNLKGDQVSTLAAHAGWVILKWMTLEGLPLSLQNELKIDATVAKNIALELASRIFLPIRDYLRGTENFILGLGGTLPSIIPSASIAPQPTPPSQLTPPEPAKAPPIQKPFRQAVKENKEILNQLLTNNPIRLTDFEQPVRPSIKNWLADYIKQKGAGHHESLERSDYLFNSGNSEDLPETERNRLNLILRAYDDDIAVPVIPENGLIAINETSEEKNFLAAEPLAPPARPAPPTPPNIHAAPPVFPPNGRPAPSVPLPNIAPKPDTYRETPNKDDLTGPLPPPPQGNLAPRLNGNIIDLKNFGDK